MLKDFKALREQVRSGAPKTVAVACAHDAHTLEAVLHASAEGILRYLLVGHRDEIVAIGRELGHEIAADAIVDADTDEEAARIAVGLIREGKADFLQKGYMQTATILKAVVNKETGIGTGGVISHTAIIEIAGYHKLLGVADGGMIPHPDLEQKKGILRNAVEAFRALGYDRPLVAAVCAAETVSPKIQETVDAAALKEAALAGEFGSCYVEGPISVDLALDKESCEIKKYDSPVSGNTDILLVPYMAVGNIFVKGLLLYGNTRMVGIVTGAKCPIALNSRSASFEEKYYSLMACAAICR
ncbi:MAG: phosphate butyryltransferase [Clostridia bacterium]|nr:phosphate butyryltransferase [Clostridia bacterium]